MLRPMNVRMPLTLLALTATLGLAACGSDSSSSSDTLSEADLAKQADAICKTAATAGGKLTPPSDFGGANSDPAAAADYLGKLVPITRKESDDLAALKPADDVKDDYQAFVDKEKQLADFLDGVYAKAKAKDASGIQDLAKAPQLGQEFSAAATKVGATGCATG